jgi:heme-degrading monooxygenase HmoA
MNVAKVVQGTIEPSAVEVAAAAVTWHLALAFSATPGARQGYWMADRSTGKVLITTIWSDRQTMQVASTLDGARRARIAEAVGLRIGSIDSLDVISSRHGGPTATPERRWARATWVEGLSPRMTMELPARHPAVAEEQAGSKGFRGSHWLARASTGDGLALSFWESEDDLHTAEGESRKRRRRLERDFGFRVGRVDRFEAIEVISEIPVGLRRGVSAAAS